MDLHFTEEDERFRAEIRGWLETHLSGEFAHLRGRGGPGDHDGAFEDRRAWEKTMAAAGWTCIAWPKEHGGRGATLMQQVIFHEEYARAGAPGSISHIGEELLGPTIIHFGSEAQKARFLPPIRSIDELWCQGYSEPGAGSDLANVQCKAELDEATNEWVITGQKVWTSLAHSSEWCFALCRTDPDVRKHKGISYLLVPMDQPGVEIRPIRQITGTEEFAEVFFDGARTAAENVVGGVNNGWKVAMGTLAFERGASTLGQQLAFHNELAAVITAAKARGASEEPALRQRLADLWIRLQIMRLNALRTLTKMGRGELSREGMVTKLYWATWHRELGEAAMEVMGMDAELMDGAELTELQRLFLWTRCDTIYAGTNQVQRNIIGERALGLPREPRPI